MNWTKISNIFENYVPKQILRFRRNPCTLYFHRMEQETVETFSFVSTIFCISHLYSCCSPFINSAQDKRISRCTYVACIAINCLQYFCCVAVALFFYYFFLKEKFIFYIKNIFLFQTILVKKIEMNDTFSHLFFLHLCLSSRK